MIEYNIYKYEKIVFIYISKIFSSNVLCFLYNFIVVLLVDNVV